MGCSPLKQATPDTPNTPNTPTVASTATNASTGLTWSSQLCVGNARLDETHAECVDQPSAPLAVPVELQILLYRVFLEHTVEHLAQQERLTLTTGLALDNCLAVHHATILAALRAGTPHPKNANPAIISHLAETLVEWFSQHATTVDAGLALLSKEVGFDPATETMADPSAIRPASMSGCRSVSCG
jgi:hemerythrin